MSYYLSLFIEPYKENVEVLAISLKILFKYYSTTKTTHPAPKTLQLLGVMKTQFATVCVGTLTTTSTDASLLSYDSEWIAEVDPALSLIVLL